MKRDRLAPERLWGLSRSLVAGSAVLTLLFNSPADIHVFSAGLKELGLCESVAAASVPCLLEDGNYGWTSHLILLAGFAAVVSGVAPRMTGLLHPYLAFSMSVCLSTSDGGEQVAQVYSLLALPICLCDARLTHWNRWRSVSSAFAVGRIRVRAFSISAKLLAVQICVIYGVAAISKLTVDEWLDGTAVYYWVSNPQLSPIVEIAPLVGGIFSVPVIVLLSTYCAVLLEGAICVSFFVSRIVRSWIVFCGFGFHFMIGLAFGIWSFVLVMWGALCVLLIDFDKLVECTNAPSTRGAQVVAIRGEDESQ